MTINILKPSQGFLLLRGLGRPLKTSHQHLHGLTHAYLTSSFQHKTLISLLVSLHLCFLCLGCLWLLPSASQETITFNKAFLSHPDLLGPPPLAFIPVPLYCYCSHSTSLSTYGSMCLPLSVSSPTLEKTPCENRDNNAQHIKLPKIHGD